ncbi:ribosome maturation factor RimM [Bifidobacterium sp. ESL0728]|uniref:ribosome maturation factor RimM n=1 Tax=Bifidobacterium sp. ESL0728 TaxID=2983220 RepID=UPI0023F88683|nr:ribosome maturation factor RimM [Bifidobacterium sp. ESL0728]WEV60015.1 ribosome maturation factor RimM [Bifidobacterium sp. ESL0728]
MSQQADPQQRELLRVCRIGRAQGLKGEVNVRSFTDEPELRFAPGSVLYTKDGSHTYTVAHSRTFKDRWILHFKGVDNRDASEALNGTELYVEADDPEEMAEEDAWYPKDLIGLEARVAQNPSNGTDASKSGSVIGKVLDVIDGPAQSLLKIRLATPVIEQKDGSFVAASAAGTDNGNDSSANSENTDKPNVSKESKNKSGKNDAAKVVKTALVPFVDELVPDIDLDERYLTLDPPVGLVPGL